jgi:uncharacterized protein YegP (UPF0339 family)
MAHIEIYRGARNLFHWRVKNENGEIVCWSKGFHTLEAARRNARLTGRKGTLPPGSSMHETYNSGANWLLERFELQ